MSKKWDSGELFDHLDMNKDGKVSIENLRKKMKEQFGLSLSPSQITILKPDSSDNTGYITRELFTSHIDQILSLDSVLTDDDEQAMPLKFLLASNHERTVQLRCPEVMKKSGVC